MSENFLYVNDQVGLKFLSVQELAGRYPHWFADAQVCAHNSHGAFPMSSESCRAYIESLQHTKSSVVFAVYHVSDDVHIGNVSLQSIDWINRSAEIAFIFGEKQYWGQGFAEQAARLVLTHAFSVLNLQRVHCGTAATNVGMQKLALKLGMQQEGVRRQALFLSGCYQDIVEFGILSHEFDCGAVKD